MIKPEFFDDPAIADLTPFARLFFIGLWMQADRDGRLQDDCKRLKARLFPYDNLDTEALAAELHGSDLIRRYSGPDGKKYIWIRTFVKHQRPHPKEPPSLIPPCSNGDGKRNGTPCLKMEGTSESGVLILDSGTRNLDQEPPNPLSAKGGKRYLRADLKEAQRIRKLRFGKCHHDPPCDDHIKCEVLMALDIAARRKAAAS